MRNMKGLATASPDRCGGPRDNSEYPMPRDALNLINLNQRKAEVSYAIAVMVRIGGLGGMKSRRTLMVGARFAASMWIFTQTEVCDGHRHM